MFAFFRWLFRRVFQYQFEIDLRSSPEELWPLVSNTDQVNQDVGFQPVERLATGQSEPDQRLAMPVFRMKLLNWLTVEWLEKPFQWVINRYFEIHRQFISGPVKTIDLRLELEPLASGGTRLKYQLSVSRRNFLGRLLIPLEIGWFRLKKFEAVYREYDRRLSAKVPVLSTPKKVRLQPGAEERAIDLMTKVQTAGADLKITDKLVKLIVTGDDQTVARMRPNSLADQWRVSRQEVLKTCLLAAKAGMLDFRWELVCPHCRGAKVSVSGLDELGQSFSCPSCQIVAEVDFSQYLEIVFRPNPAIRQVEISEYCVGSPRKTSHIVAQQVLAPGEVREAEFVLPSGAYRVRIIGESEERELLVGPTGPARAILALNGRLELLNPDVSQNFWLVFKNVRPEAKIFIVEKIGWNRDQSVTGADVVLLKEFRELFPKQILKKGSSYHLGSRVILFTDLKGSTKFYREVGDAPAFDEIIHHFRVVDTAVRDGGGQIIKKIGDAVMAVFHSPAKAIQAMLTAQDKLSGLWRDKPLKLRVGLHFGPCLLVTIDGRLDLFGTTVNLAARLEGQSTGQDIIISDPVFNDPEVRRLILEGIFQAKAFKAELKGFDQEVRLHRLTA